MLSHSTVARYVLENGLVSAESVVKGDFVVNGIFARNHIFKVMTNHGTSYLLKQGVDLERRAAVDHEAFMYRLFYTNNNTRKIWPFLASFSKYDHKDNILIIKIDPKSENLRSYYSRTAHFSTRISTSLGKILAILHSFTKQQMEAEHIKTDQLEGPPAVLTLFLNPDFEMVKNMSNAEKQIIKIVQQHTKFAESLRRILKEWDSKAIVHNDIRWNNCIISRNPLRNTYKKITFSLQLVDWELASLGDPWWDVGSLFSEYLTFWIFSIPITEAKSPAEFVPLAKFPLERMQPAIRAFWSSYVRNSNINGIESAGFLIRTIKYTAIRMLQTAFEAMRTSTHISSAIVCILQISLNILERPEQAIAQLVGIEI